MIFAFLKQKKQIFIKIKVLCWFWSILIRFYQLYPQHRTGWQSLATELGRDAGTLSPLEIIIQQGGWCVVSILRYSPPFLSLLIIWNVECKPEFKIVKVTLCVMDLRGRGVSSLPRLRDLSNAEKLKHAEYSPFHGKTCFFRYIVIGLMYWRPGTWVMILASCQTLSVFYILPHSYLVC